MATYLGWPVVDLPTAPAAPASIEFTVIDPTALVVSPFTGQQQLQSWNVSFMDASVAMPAMPGDVAEAWVAFFRALRGQLGVFQFGVDFSAKYSSSIGARYWRLKSNSRKWSINEARVYGFQFDIREAL